MFTVFAEYDEPYNLYLVISAFNALEKMLSPALFSTTRLVFIGRCETDKQRNELNKLTNIVLAQETNISEKIYLRDVNDCIAVDTFLRKSLALIDVTEDVLWSSVLLRAFQLGKPVICFGSGFNQELVKHERTGVIVAKRAHSLRNCLHRFVTSRQWAINLGEEVRREAARRFSLGEFRENICRLTAQYNVLRFRSCPPTAISYCQWAKTSSYYTY